MPNNPTPPSEEASGQSALPLSRIKKIIRLDEDIHQCPNNTTFLVAIATEMFIRYLTEQGHKVARSDRKPRKNVQYRDLATAVSRIDNLEFLSDVIPKTTTYRQFKEKRARETAGASGAAKSQRAVNGRDVVENGEGNANKEESTVEADGHDEKPALTSSPRLPTVIHSSHERSLMAEEVKDTEADDDDVEMLDS